MENKNMYSAGYALCVISNGKVLPELADGSVLCPFGSEYKLRLHNKNSKRARARIWIDGEEVTSSSSADGILVGANSFIELERPVDKPVRFKFVDRTSMEAVEACKDGPDPMKEMGVVRVEFTEEADLPRPLRRPMIPYTQPDWYHGHSHFRYGTGPVVRGMSSGKQEFMASANACLSNANPMVLGFCEEGCTVEGGYSDQTFSSTTFQESGKPAVCLQLVLKGASNETVSTTSSSLKKSRADRAQRQAIQDLKDQMAVMQRQLAELESR